MSVSAVMARPAWQNGVARVATGNTSQITDLLVAWGNGDAEALEQLMPLVDRELQQLAHHYMAREPIGHPLSPFARA